MSRATVRAAIQSFLAPPAVAGLNVIWPTKPKDLGSKSFAEGQPAGTKSGAMAAIMCEHQHEKFEGFDGGGGVRLITYLVRLEIFHRSTERKAEDAMAHFDSVVDGVCDRLRRNPSLGGAAILSSAVEQLSVEYGDPELTSPDGGGVDTWAAIRFAVQEATPPL